MLKISKSSLMIFSGIYDTKILKTNNFSKGILNVNFLALTKEKIGDKVSELSATVAEQTEEVEDEFELELEQEDLVKKADEISAKADKLVSKTATQVGEAAEKVSDELAD